MHERPPPMRGKPSSYPYTEPPNRFDGKPLPEAHVGREVVREEVFSETQRLLVGIRRVTALVRPGLLPSLFIILHQKPDVTSL